MTSEGRLVYSIRGLLLKKLTSRGSRHVNGEDSSLRRSTDDPSIR